MHFNSFSSLAVLALSYGALEVQAAALRSGGYITAATVSPTSNYNVGARIVIGTCIGNVGGKLVYLPGGAFGNSCSDVTFGGPGGSIMTAKCGDGNGLILTTQIDLIC
ncbi:hypothetical protein B9Z65_4028 [Elsinoe australis]|uniref:Cyanovirin-N domain-containing protein n=1 Tax=Elsinoe australis TaxID=40998 RepID=A0A2P7Z1M1_9PEZI|nr:hypothetical protein B9Z65_4028 [Elsinoe australis]